MSMLLKQDPFVIIIQVIICLCIMALFISIFMDFMFYSRNENVRNEKKSIVETGTMTMFFFIFYIILRTGIGVIPVQSSPVKISLMIIGTVIIAAGCIMNILGRVNLGRNWANHIKIYNEHTLVKNGMYKFVRHPLYSSIIYMFYGACLVYRNYGAFLAVTFIFIPFMYYRAKQEEYLLLQNFKDYSMYIRNTGMFFPKVIRRKE